MFFYHVYFGFFVVLKFVSFVGSCSQNSLSRLYFLKSAKTVFFLKSATTSEKNHDLMGLKTCKIGYLKTYKLQT